MTPLLVVGAHLDDAVLSCGRLLAATPGAVVVTVFAGRPSRLPPGTTPPGTTPLGTTPPGTTEWDAACGFRPGDDVVGTRCAEDDAALAVLGARAVRLPFVDAQYAGPVDVPAQVRDVAAALGEVLVRERPTRVLTPLGLLHRDHRVVAAAALRLPAAGRSAYDDAPYRSFVPLRARLAALARAGVRLGPPVVTTDADVGPDAALRARRAVAAYGSQAAGLATLAVRAGGPAAGPARGLPGDVVRAVLGCSGARPAGVRAASSPRPSRGRAARPG